MSARVPAAIAEVSPSVAVTTVYRTSGVKAEAITVSQRKPIASPKAVESGTPRTARLATASSQRIRVRKVEAAKTTAYWRRNWVLVKSIWVVESIAPESFRTSQAAAVAQPWARDCRGSRGLLEGAMLPPVPCC